MPSNNNNIKVVLLGESGVGKSSLALVFCTNEFRPYSESTIGASFMSKTLDNGVSFNIWDTAGQEKYHSLAPMYYRGAAAAVLVFDLLSLNSFECIKNWVKELQSNGPPDIVLCVCGNKTDLAEHRQVSAEDAQAYANEVGAAFYIETSARDHVNVNELFEQISKHVPVTSSQHQEDGLDLRYQEGGTRSGCC